MSQQLISRSPDLQRLQDEGYDIEVRAGFLIVRDVPYVNGAREILRGILVAPLTTAGEVAAPPGDHVIEFVGETPCDANGVLLDKIMIGSAPHDVYPGLRTTHRFSSKPHDTGRYTDFHSKVRTYVGLLLSHAMQIDPAVRANNFNVPVLSEEDSVFKYVDTASSRARITAAARKLDGMKVGIIGVGGTGSYVLDLIAKTWVKEIHLFDGDDMLTHNAFRSPGGISVEDLNAKPKKAEHFAQLYSRMRHGIIAHTHHIDDANLNELDALDVVFICVDSGESRKQIVKYLERIGKVFVDTGMGVESVDDQLRGTVRVTTSTPTQRDHFRNRVSLGDRIDDDYLSNIQIAELNALNAALAVIRWKKLVGFYLDFVREHHTTYTLNSNMLLSEHQS